MQNELLEKIFRHSFDTEKKKSLDTVSKLSSFSLTATPHLTSILAVMTLRSPSCKHKHSYSGCSLLTSLPC